MVLAGVVNLDGGSDLGLLLGRRRIKLSDAGRFVALDRRLNIMRRAFASVPAVGRAS